jgi:Fe-S oxidoreductase
MHEPAVSWSRSCVTQYLADNIAKLGPLAPVPATITIHDACHQVRGEKPEASSPRTIARAIPGLTVIEMENSAERALCCGTTAIPAVGKPGVDFRARRLREAAATGAEIMALYCPGCQSVFAPARGSAGVRIESLITLLGRAAGISHEDTLARYLGYRDPQRVLAEAEACLQASELPTEKLAGFIGKYFS